MRIFLQAGRYCSIQFNLVSPDGTVFCPHQRVLATRVLPEYPWLRTSQESRIQRKIQLPTTVAKLDWLHDMWCMVLWAQDQAPEVISGRVQFERGVKGRGGGVRRLAIIAPLPYTQYHVLGFHAYALPTRCALTSVCGFSKLLCLWPPQHNHLRETEVTQWQLNSWEEMSSCHHGIKMPEDAGLLSGECWVHFKAECGKKQ